MASRASALSMLKDMFPTVSTVSSPSLQCCTLYVQMKCGHHEMQLCLQIPTETIAAVLENHEGDVEGSIEALLSVCSPVHSTDKVRRQKNRCRREHTGVSCLGKALMGAGRSKELAKLTLMPLCRACRRPHPSVSLQTIKCGGMRSLQGRCRSVSEFALMSCSIPPCTPAHPGLFQ